jgi:hypothetical protein
MISMIIADLPKLFFSFVVSLLCDVNLLTAAVQFHISTISPHSSGPLGKFGNTQSPATGPRQGALRREWHALSKKCNAELAQ